MTYYLFQFNNLLLVVLLITEYVCEYRKKQQARIEQLTFFEKVKLIVVISTTCGAGKSTTSRYLSNKYGGIHLDLDTIYWNDTLDFNESVRLFFKENKKKRIFIDGIYKSCVNEHWHMADCIIIIDTPPFIRFLNIFYREILVNKCNKGFYSIYNLLKNSTGFGYQEKKNIKHIHDFRILRKKKYDDKITCIEEKKKQQKEKYQQQIKKVNDLKKSDEEKKKIIYGIKNGYDKKIKKIEEEKGKIKGRRIIPEFIV